MKKSVIIGIAFLLSVVVSCKNNSSSPTQPSGMGTISGRVTDSATGAPIFGAYVIVVPADTTKAQVKYTDASGNYLFTGIPAGVATIIATDTAYVLDSTTVTVPAGGTVTQNFALVKYGSGASGIPMYIPTNGLLAWYPFNDNAKDESGNGNNATVYGATPAMGQDGKPSQAYSFNGTSDYLDAAIPNIPTGNQPRSISVWFYLNPAGTINYGETILGWGAIAQNQRAALFIVSGNGNPDYIGQGNDLNDVTDNLFNQPGWHNFIFTFDGNTAKIYVDGTIRVQNAMNFNTSLTDLLIGWNGDNTHNGGEYFSGSIDDVAIWSRALTQTEVTAVYNQ